jgi:hypothetical protein
MADFENIQLNEKKFSIKFVKSDTVTLAVAHIIRNYPGQERLTEGESSVQLTSLY